MPHMGIALCGRCRRDVLPQLAQPSWHRDKHRASASEREPEPSVAAKKAMRKADRSLRRQVRAVGMIETAKLFLAMKAGRTSEPVSDDCPECRQLQYDAA